MGQRLVSLKNSGKYINNDQNTIKVLECLILFISLSLLLATHTATAENTSRIFDNIISQIFTDEKEIRGKINSSMLSLLGISLGATTITEIKEKIGSANEYHTYSSGHKEKEICYASKNKNDNTVLIFNSGVMGSYKVPTHYVLVNNKDGKYMDTSK